MKRTIGIFAITSIFALALAGGASAKDKSVKLMSHDEMIKTARSAAPPQISDNATIMIPGVDGKLQEAVKGSNGFTCIPDISAQERPDPVCADGPGTEWIMSVMNNEPKPANTEPGVGYMAQGGWHWEKDGKVIMDPKTPNAKRVKEPPHWMIFWPFSAEETRLPDRHVDDFGTYVMYDGTPYAHLMIYQNPNKLPKKK